MKKILFAVLMFAAIPVFAGVSSTFPYGLKASTITVTGQTTLSSTTVNNTLTVSSTTEMQTAVLYSTMNVYGAMRFDPTAIADTSSVYKIDMTGVNTALKIGNMVWGSAYGNSTWANVGGASINLGNVEGESMTFTTANNVTNATAGQQFTSRLALSNTTADVFRWNASKDGTTTDTALFGMNNNYNVYAKYGISASSITLGGVTITSWNAVGGDVLQAGNNTMSGTNNFTGTVQVNGSTAAIPTVMYASPSGAYSSTFSFTCNGVYQLDWSLTMGGSVGQISINFDGASTGHYGMYSAMDSANRVGTATTWDSRSVVYLNYNGYNVAANGPAEGSATINCLSASNTFVNATYMSDDSDGYWRGGWIRGLYTAGHPNAIYVKTTSPASGSLRLRKVSD